MSAECSAGVIPPGYKQTEVGMIPEDWGVKKFGEIAAPRNKRVDPRKDSIQYFCVELEHIGSSTGFLLGHTSTSEQSSIKTVFQSGDVLFGKLRAYLRKYWLADRPGVCSTEIWVLTPLQGNIDYGYLFQVVQTDQFIEAASSTYGTHMPRSDWNVVKNYSLPIPPTLAEQDAIAEALSDADALIESLEQLIIKKRQIKQGAMQELLTGKRRLPGFGIKAGYKQTEMGLIPEDWSVITLSRITSEIGDGIHSTPEYSINGDYFFVNGNNIQNGCIVITKDTKSTNVLEYNKHKKNLSSDRTLLLSINGTIGNVAFYSGEPIFLGKSAAYINVNENISRLLVFYLLQTANVTAYFNEGLTGTTIKNLGLNTIRNTPIPIPSTEAEQNAIAAILSDMDSEITALEEKLTKARQIKQGMMQELLTGRVRLV